MIKQIIQFLAGTDTDMLYCDHCGEGIALNTDDIAAIDIFHSEHHECTKPLNSNLAFLQDTEPFDG